MDFGAQSLSALFPDCLHLRSIVTFASPKLATNDAATSYWMRFPLINLYTLLGVPFVPPVHNQGVSLAPCQGLALWKIFLPTTGSFFVLSFTDLFCMLHKPAPCGGRFSGLFLIPFSFPATAEFNSQICFLKAQFNCSRNITCFVSGCYAACICGLLISPISFSAS